MFHDSLNYETQYGPVKSIDPQQHVIEATSGRYVLSKGNPFYLCGLLEELDAPGEWCVDPGTSTLYFWPPRGNPNGRDEVILPALTWAFLLKGDPGRVLCQPVAASAARRARGGVEPLGAGGGHRRDHGCGQAGAWSG